MKNLNKIYSEMKKMLKYHLNKDKVKALYLNVAIHNIKRSFVFERQLSRFFSLHSSHYSLLNNKKLCIFKLD